MGLLDQIEQSKARLRLLNSYLTDIKNTDVSKLQVVLLLPNMRIGVSSIVNASSNDPERIRMFIVELEKEKLELESFLKQVDMLSI